MPVCSITDLAIECQNAKEGETREKAMDYMTTRMFRFLKRKGKSRIRANDLVIVYLIFKLVYMSHTIFQIFILNMFLGSNYANYGVEVLWKLLHGKDLMNSKRFPRVTMCDFKIRLFGNLQRCTVQCALPINLYNEIIFIFIWFWFILITFVSFYSFCFFLWKAVYARGQIRFVETRIESGVVKRKGHNLDGTTKLTSNVKENYDQFIRRRREKVNNFVKYNLRGDGVFLLRMVAWNSSGLIAIDLVTRLWDIYTGKAKSPKADDEEEEQKQPLMDRSTSIS